MTKHCLHDLTIFSQTLLQMPQLGWWNPSNNLYNININIEMSHKHLRRVSMWYSKPINWTGLEQKQNQIKFQISKVTWVCAGREGAGGPVEGFPSQVSRRTLSMWGTFFLSEFFLRTLFFCQNFPFWEFFYLSQVLSIISICRNSSFYQNSSFFGTSSVCQYL